MTAVPRTTDAAVLVEVGKPLQLMTVAIPTLKPGQLLVEVVYSGVCHSQLLEVRGLRGPDRFVPHTLGHEGSGTVLAVGPGVAKVKPRQRVVLSWIKGKGADVPSTVYQSASGRVNSGAISTFIRHAVTCENRVIPIPDHMPLREAALLGCAVPTGAGIVFNSAKVAPGSTVAVLGVGGIGLSAVLAARSVGATVIALDVSEARLALARDVGATFAIDVRRQDPAATIGEITDGRGVDYAIEAAGRRETMELGLRIVRENGGLCVIAGNLPHGERISIDPFDLIRGKQIVGTWGGETQPDRDIPRYLELYGSGKLPLDKMIGRIYELHEVNEALADLENGQAGRPLVRLGGKVAGPGESA